jgi:hypothetical protein
LIKKYISRPSIQYVLNNEEAPRGSVIWEGIQKVRDLAKSRAIWKLGNGEEIHFWMDSWLHQGPLINNPRFERWAEDCIRQFGTRVKNYRIGQDWRDLTLISGDLAPIMIMLNSMILGDQKDELVWGDTSSGLYTVASGYNSLWRVKEKPPWASAWLPGLTPKINIFYWLALQDKILT